MKISKEKAIEKVIKANDKEYFLTEKDASKIEMIANVAARNNRFDIVKLMIKKGAPLPNIPEELEVEMMSVCNEMDDILRTVLKAIDDSDMDVFKLNLREYVKYRNINVIACHSIKDIDFLEHILESYGSQVNMDDLIRHAVKESKSDILDLIVEEYEDLLNSGNDLIYCAVENDDLAMVKFLYDYGFDICFTDYIGRAGENVLREIVRRNKHDLSHHYYRHAINDAKRLEILLSGDSNHPIDELLLLSKSDDVDRVLTKCLAKSMKKKMTNFQLKMLRKELD